MSDSIYLYQCHCLNLHSQCLYLPNNPNTTIPFTAIPQYMIISPTALDVQHFLKPCSHLR
jgi:hypothetical protein